ncbi:hypothetical protein BAE44_0019641 [Dichanthelium oligosanthes]|uniref:Uncharacterized protein n=1 Tax=Dichanthelium oligosanthes TaxID=888268 RepID=A0A1E5V2F9_9POAL|nr:hypothetical protein BAE44_0019641 [Dichanthelium oligosanthes]
MSSFQPQEIAAASKLCAAGCGFFGSQATHDMCSVCFKKHHCVVTGGPGASSPAMAGSVVAVKAAAAVAAPGASISFAPGVAEAAVSSSSAPEAVKKAQPIRCVACYKKVGLTGFVCRCGKTFCGRHRYAEEHGCAFDFKGAGRDTIARANPLIKGEKLTGKI